MSMFNECHIYLCDCTWLIVFSHAQSLLIKHKKICDFLVVFGKYFVFTKIVKISKTVLPCSGNSVEGWSSCMPQSRAHTEIFCDSLAGQCPSREKYLEYFSKIWFSYFLRLRLATCSRMEGPVARGTQRFLRLSSRLSREWNFQSRKTLRNFFFFKFSS